MAAGDDHVASIGENRKLVIFKLDELPEMPRGKGVRLQKFKDGGLADVRTFKLADGLSWTDTSGTKLDGQQSGRMAGCSRPGRSSATKGISKEQ